MAATVRRLVSKPDRLEAEQAELLLSALQPYEAAMPSAVRELKAHIHRQTSAQSGWTFIMVSAVQHDAVVEWLATNSRRPMKAVRLWSKLFTAVDRATNEVMLTRNQLADLVSESPDNVSAIMGELESIGAISRRRERVAGMRGPGVVRYFMNPMVGTHLPGGLRDAAQADAPPGPLLRVMEGGKAP